MSESPQHDKLLSLITVRAFIERFAAYRRRTKLVVVF